MPVVNTQPGPSTGSWAAAALMVRAVFRSCPSPRATQLSSATTARSTSNRAYLVPQSNVDAFREEVGRLQSAHPERTIVCTGPWPPYSFTAPAEDA